MLLYLCVLIVFSLHQESLKLILVDEPLPEVVLSQYSTFARNVIHRYFMTHHASHSCSTVILSF
jgi:hypothetical protein